jgi:tetratricopeptide (TPR) repeat protein
MSRHQKAALLACFLLVVGLCASFPALADENAETVAEDAALSAIEIKGQTYSHLMRALFASQRGESRLVSVEIRKAIELQPDNPDLHLQGAGMLLALGRSYEAEQLIQRVLINDAEHIGAMRMLADILATRVISSGRDRLNLEQALQSYRKLEELTPLDATEMRQRANLKLLAGDYSGALADTQQLVDLTPGDFYANRMLYRLLVHLERGDEALQSLLRFIVRHPEETELFEEANDLAVQLNAWQLVVEELGAADAEIPLTGAAAALHGKALLRLGMLDQAADAFEDLVADGAENITIRLGLVEAYANSGRIADAAALTRGLTIDYPDDPSLQYIKGQTLARQGESEDALGAFEAALRLLRTRDTGDAGQEDRDSIRSLMLGIHLSLNDIEDAEKVLADFERPDQPVVLRLSARLALMQEDWQTARRAAGQLKQLGEPGEAELIEGEISAFAGHWPKANDFFQITLEKIGPYASSRIADSYLRAGRPLEGEKLLRSWVEKQPGNPDALFELAQFLYRQEQIQQAEEALWATLEADPNFAPALNFLGYSMAERGENLETARDLIERALEQNSWEGAYLDSLGWTFYMMGEFESARQPLETAARQYPRDATILDHLGDVYIELGERELALAAWNKALESTDSNDGRIRSKITSLEATVNAQGGETDVWEGLEARPDREAAPDNQ